MIFSSFLLGFVCVCSGQNSNMMREYLEKYSQHKSGANTSIISFFTSVFMPKKIKFEDYEAKTDAMKNLIDNKYSKKLNQELALSKV